jgi:hypothetical protein
MDPNRLKQAYAKLRALDERLTYKVRPRSGGTGLLARPTADQLEEKVRDLADYTLELKDVVQELILAIGSRPAGPKGDGGDG